MIRISVPVSTPYDVVIGAGLLPQTAALLPEGFRARSVLLVSDSNVAPLYADRAAGALSGLRVARQVVPAGERSKSIESYVNLLNALARERLTRTDAVFALGGGVVGDLSGFAAATYLRGLPFVQLPTSLLAMVDSSVGGKTAIDLPAGKNLAGAFYQPWLVLCDPDCLDSLPDEIFRDGCAEVIKYAVLGNAPFFDELKNTPPHAQLEHIIETCVRMKRDIVAQDEFDRGQRQLLNLGHTFGHGIEACSGFSVSHGSAVAIGMAMIVRAAAQFGICEAEARDAVLTLLRQYGLPVDCTYAAEQMLGTILHDKKASGGSINLIVPTAVGRCEIRKTPAGDIPDWLRAGGAQ